MDKMTGRQENAECNKKMIKKEKKERRETQKRWRKGYNR